MRERFRDTFESRSCLFARIFRDFLFYFSPSSFFLPFHSQHLNIERKRRDEYVVDFYFVPVEATRTTLPFRTLSSNKNNNNINTEDGGETHSFTVVRNYDPHPHESDDGFKVVSGTTGDKPNKGFQVVSRSKHDDKDDEFVTPDLEDIDEEEITSEMQGQENSDAIRFMKASKRR